MEWLFIIIIGIAIWYWVSSSSRKSGRARPQTELGAERPEVTVTVTSSASRSGNRADPEDVDVGEMVSAGERAWVLNPKSPLPLTLLNADLEIAKDVRKLLGSREYWANKVPDLALLIAQHNLRVKEVDAFITDYKPKFDALMAKLIATSSEWPSASAKDREDLRVEFEEKAFDSLGVWIGQADLATLLEGEPSSLNEDDELLRRFQGNSGLYSFYLATLSRSSSVATVKADDYGRKHWEQLVEMGFARRGKEIPVPLILDGLRLKDINMLLTGAIPKPLGRKAKAIEVAVALPDIADRLSNHVSFREMFQVLRPADIDVDGIVKSFAYATDVATVIQQTYYTGVRTLGALQERKRESGVYDAWEISNWEDPLPSCAAAVCRKYDRLPAKRPPFHVGCSCQLECSFKD